MHKVISTPLTNNNYTRHRRHPRLSIITYIIDFNTRCHILHAFASLTPPKTGLSVTKVPIFPPYPQHACRHNPYQIQAAKRARYSTQLPRSNSTFIHIQLSASCSASIPAAHYPRAATVPRRATTLFRHNPSSGEHFHLELHERASVARGVCSGDATNIV